MIVGYRRVSTSDQHLDRQQLGTDVEKMFEEHISGRSLDRPALKQMLEFIREGDLVRVWSIDRLGRSLRDLNHIVEAVAAKGAGIHFVSENLKFSAASTDPFSKMQFQMLGMFAEFEYNLALQRRREGIAAARASGRYKQANLDTDKAIEMRASGATMQAIADATGVSKATISRFFKTSAAG